MRTVSGVRGDLLHWARVQQGFTMRWVQDNGGPSPAYQSEVERGKKRQVLSRTLASWITVLNVSEDFAQGKLPQYHLNPSACLGLAKEIGILVTNREGGGPDWTQVNQEERVRQVLKLMIQQSSLMPAVVMAWILNLDIATIRSLVEGQQRILRVHVEAAAQLTMLPERFFTHGQIVPPDQFAGYKPVVQRAAQLGISARTLMRILELHGRHLTVRKWKRPG